MNNITKRQIQSYIMEYLSKRVTNFTIKKKMFTCPKCGEICANIFPPNSNKVHCFSPTCGSIGDIFKLARHLDFDDCEDITNDDIAVFLIKEFNIQTDDKTETLFAQYSEWQWDLVPVSANDKASNIEKEWQKKTHKDISEWKQWYNNGLNHGVKTGIASNILCLDFDFVDSELKKKIYNGKGTEKDFETAKLQHEENYKKLKEFLADTLDWNTVIQETFGGIHIFYFFDNEIPKTTFNIDNIHVDVLAEGGQVVIEPSIVGNQIRTIKGTQILPLPNKVKAFILQNIKPGEPLESPYATNEPDLKSFDISFENLNNNRNNTFIKLGGELRKKMRVDQTSYAMYLFNRLLDKQVPQKEVNAMLRQIEKYYKVDIEEISTRILEHMKLVGDAHVRDIRECLGYDRQDLEQALKYLCDKKKIYKIKKDLYKFIEDIEWQEDFFSVGKPLSVTVPYFDKYAEFENGSMVIIGARSGGGKSHLSVNFIKKFVEQGIYPYLVSTEAGSKFAKVAQTMGLKEGDFGYHLTKNPTLVPIKDKSVTIIDWLKPPDSDYAKTDAMYESLNEQLAEKGGLMIVFTQLKPDNTFYADAMTHFYGTLVAKFLHPEKNGIIDNLNPYFKTSKIRDSKCGKQYLDIPCTFDFSTKRVGLK